MKESTGHMFPDIYTTNHISGLGPCFSHALTARKGVIQKKLESIY